MEGVKDLNTFFKCKISLCEKEQFLLVKRKMCTIINYIG